MKINYSATTSHVLQPDAMGNIARGYSVATSLMAALVCSLRTAGKLATVEGNRTGFSAKYRVVKYSQSRGMLEYYSEIPGQSNPLLSW
jgi:hypothetical protein